MSADSLFPGYIPRPEEELIRREAALVRQDGTSRAVLLYGPGGVGKTRLVRRLRASASGDAITWLEPVDLDDSEYWLLSSLEQRIAGQLDPRRRYFGRYLDDLSRMPAYTAAGADRETAVSHLARIKQVFVECYEQFVRDTGRTVVIAFDTTEAIGGTDLFVTLTEWMKALPATLFILSGRMVPGRDPISDALESPFFRLPVTAIALGEFTEAAASDYLSSSRVAQGLTEAEKAKLVRLTHGHPLWLAFTVSYLAERGLPPEAEVPLPVIERDLPYQGDMPPEGQRLHEAFKRRLLTPYRAAGFWSEAVKRLAVVRQNVNRTIWEGLMADCPLPAGVAGLDEAWETLLHTQWIRPRASRRYVTLHDAVAEELAQRVIALHDQDGQWRRQLWQRAAGIYAALIEDRESMLATEAEALDSRLRALGSRLRAGDEEEESELIGEAARLDGEKRELDQFKTARLWYQLLCDFAGGCRQFLDLFGRARREHDVLFQDLLAQMIQRFLPAGEFSYTFDDALEPVIGDFRAWLSSVGSALYLEIGLSMADYYLVNEQPGAALDLLDRIPADHAEQAQGYRLALLRGNAHMNIPGRVQGSLRYFEQALREARAMNTADRYRFIAESYKELGFYYRNAGLWKDADDAYRRADDEIMAGLTPTSDDGIRGELASIRTNWAYIKGLLGEFREAEAFAEAAIAVRRRLQLRLEEGLSWSVLGEVYRYERRFTRAWDAYATAEQIFHEQRNWSWLGIIYQEQAICLFQAARDGAGLTPQPAGNARRLITLALDICRDQAVRGYPSALNRAGRIVGQDDPDAGLDYLAAGITEARRLSDGWFWFASLIEYAELSYRAWRATGRREYRDQIAGYQPETEQVMAEYEYPDLSGRWHILNGHLAIHDWAEAGHGNALEAALENYQRGFALMAREHGGSSGVYGIPDKFREFESLYSGLPADVRTEWSERLRRAWLDLADGSTLLLARLQELY